YYYTYSTGTSSAYELTSYFESDKYQSYASTDGGVDPTTYEVGTNLTLTPFLHGLVGYWPLNEGSGTTAYDKSGWGNEGTLLDATTTESSYGPTWTTSNCLNGEWCLSFDGVGDYIQVPDSQSLDPTSTLTILIWGYEVPNNNEPSTERDLLSKWNQCNFSLSQYLLMEFQGNNPARAHISSNGVVELVNGATPVVISQFHNVAEVYNGRIIEVYLDGKIDGTSGATGNIENTNTSLRIGWRNCYTAPEALWSGILSDAFVYNTALTAAQIQAIYNEEK
ncbi:MAG: LamG domain-containing protein, partial [Patescibacteria group bacterium]|nr:LamG domain-containing protein [Patescibacteria group bacterium]